MREGTEESRYAVTRFSDRATYRKGKVTWMSEFWFGKNVNLLGNAFAAPGVEIWRMRLEAREFGREVCRLNEGVYFLCVWEGTLVCQVNLDRISLEEGEGIFINRGVAWRLTESGRKGSGYMVIRIRDDRGEDSAAFSMEKDYMAPVLRATEFPCLKLEGQRDVHKKILDQLLAAGESAEHSVPCSQLDVEGHLCLAWSGLCREFFLLNPELKKSVYRETTRLKEILCYLHEHYREKITLREISGNCGISPGECCRFFKKHMGQTPFEYLQLYRIRQSMPELLGRAGSIGEISQRHGFNGSSYYAEMFKKEMGCAPGDYRKWYLGKDEEECPLSFPGKMVPEKEERVSLGRRAVGQDSMPAHLL